MSTDQEFSLLSLFLSQISQFCSLILSHPLYFSYVLFFSPYIFKVLSFLSPLFTTTFLLLLVLAFFKFSHYSHQNQNQNQNQDNNDQFPDHLDWFNTVFNFNTPSDHHEIIPLDHEVQQQPEIKKEINTPSDQIPIIQYFPLDHDVQEQPEIKKEINSVFNTPSDDQIIPTIQFPLDEVQEQPEIKREIKTVLSQVVNKEEEEEEETKEDDHDIRENGNISSSKSEAKMGMNYKSFDLGSCKLVFEDHHHQDEMDLLWEKYEDKEYSTNMEKLVVEEESRNKRCNSKKKDLRSLVNHQKKMEELEEEEEEENGKICCLQALKFSTSKMKFGMGKKSGLKKISKAFKGLKFLHQLANNGKNKTHS